MVTPFGALMVKIGADTKGLSVGLASASTSMKSFSTTNKAALQTMGKQFLILMGQVIILLQAGV